MQLKRCVYLLGLFALASSLAPSFSAARNSPRQPPQRPETITCESHKDHRNYCEADTRGGVTLVRKLGHADCVLGRTWGYDAQGIWVEGGCRAEFQVNPYSGVPVWGNSGHGHHPSMPGGSRWERGGACFYKDIDFEGEYFCMKRGESIASLPPGFNDKISSIKIFGDATVTVYNDSNFGGRNGTTRRDVDNLKHWRTADDPSRNWNDRISAIQVQ